MPRPPIIDEFTDLPISRQRKFQLRLARDLKCQRCCTRKAEAGNLCLKCRVELREEVRRKRGAKRRYASALSYQMEDLKKRKKNMALACIDRDTKRTPTKVKGQSKPCQT